MTTELIATQVTTSGSGDLFWLYVFLILIAIVGFVLVTLKRYKKITTKELITKTTRFIFPYGNFRWHLVYIPMLFGLGISIMFHYIIINYLDQGLLIQTDTFVAVMPFTSSHMLNQFEYDVIGFLLSTASYTWLAFFAHTIISFIVDCGGFTYNKIFRGIIGKV